MRKLRTLLVYQNFREGIVDFYESHIQRLREAGFEVEGNALAPGADAGAQTSEFRLSGGDGEILRPEIARPDGR